MEFALNVENLLTVLPVMGYGMLGIFIVTGIIIGVVSLLNKMTSR
ncbi:MAG: oxaloacetate decarboxylase [Oscillospiraceae bacterium]|nr:oxaloacetate decarboxylase [Oscillospiraceae bacterium]